MENASDGSDGRVRAIVPMRDGELKLGMIDATFKLDIMISSFSGQVRSPIYDVISKPPHSHKMSQICNASNDRQFFSGRGTFQKVTSLRIFTFTDLGFFMQVISGQVSHVTYPVIARRVAQLVERWTPGPGGESPCSRRSGARYMLDQHDHLRSTYSSFDAY